MVQSGKADAMMVDLPPAIAAVDLTGGRSSCSARSTTRRPMATPCPRTRPTSRTPSSTPLKALEKDGTYKAILTKWKCDGGAITDFGVNLGQLRDDDQTMDRPGEINARPVRHPGRWWPSPSSRSSPR